MSEDKVDYGEIICEAVDTIVSTKLQGLSYDITKTCTIIDDTYKKQGKYTVTDNSIKFEAYSPLTTLNVDDNVLVNIPYGDYNNQKTILNKVVYTEESEVLNYKSPLESMLKFTDNILDDIVPVGSKEFNSILANGETQMKLLYSFKWDDYSGFDRMGVSVDFQSWLSKLNTVSGIYGLKFIFRSKTSTGSLDNEQAYELDFNINDMIGDPYRFETYINQSKLFDISKLENIRDLEIYLYQNGEFYNENGDKIPWEIGGDPILQIDTKPMNDNIFVKDIQIYLGYQFGEFNGDSLKISTADYLSYSKVDKELDDNFKRNLNLRWIHQVDDIEYKSLTKADIIEYGIEVYWFRYSLNQSNTFFKQIAGANWSRTGMKVDDLDPFKCTFQPDITKPEEKIKVVCKIRNKDGLDEYYTSNILVFENELATVDVATYQAANGLSIYCKDGSGGNYFIYNQSGEIINEGQGQGYARQFEVRYRGYPLTETSDTGLKVISRVVWILPIDADNDSYSSHTMLTYKPEYYSGNELTDTATQELSTYRIQRSVGNPDFSYQQNYSIKNNWHSSNSSNVIRCQVWADDNIYEAALELNFGKAGSSGTNITLVLDYANGENALDVSKARSGKSYTIEATMYDMSGSKVSPNGIWEWDWYKKPPAPDFIHLPDPEQRKSSKIDLTLNKDFGNIRTDNYYILQASFTPSGEDSTTLTSYLPIALKQPGYSYIEGARKVIYNAQGIPNYYTDAYILYNSDQEEISAVWNFQHQDASPKVRLKTLKKNNTEYKALLADCCFTSGQYDTVCVYAIVANVVVWAQPILIMQSEYDYAMLNEWTGEMQAGDNTILSALLGAGIKDNENRFSGILIGNIKQTGVSENPKEEAVGIYGISKGTNSFYLTQDGRILLGKRDKGYFEADNEQTLLSDVDGHLNFNATTKVLSVLQDNTPQQLILSGNSGQPYFQFTAESGHPLLKLNKTGSLIQSANDNFQLNLDNGSTIIRNGSSIVTASLAAGSGTAYLGTVPSGNYVINFGNFKVKADGTVEYKGKELTAYIDSLITAAKI